MHIESKGAAERLPLIQKQSKTLGDSKMDSVPALFMSPHDQALS